MSQSFLHMHINFGWRKSCDYMFRVGVNFFVNSKLDAKRFQSRVTNSEINLFAQNLMDRKTSNLPFYYFFLQINQPILEI